MKKSRVVLLFALIWLLSACTGRTSQVTMNTTETASSGRESVFVQYGAFTLSFAQTEDGWYFSLGDGTKTVLENRKPASVLISMGENGAPTLIASPYDAVVKQEDSIAATAMLETRLGSVLKISDLYSLTEQAIAVNRTVSVVEVGEGDIGFCSVFSLEDPDARSQEFYEYFIPSIIYKDSSEMSERALLSELSEINYIKETRCATPLVMLRDQVDGYSFALVHINPQISCGENIYQNPHAVSETIQYGALGYRFGETTSVDFVYPSHETPKSYETGSEVQRYHPFAENMEHCYSLGILVNHLPTYQEAMVDVYLSAVSVEDPVIKQPDLDKVYSSTIELYNSLYVRFDGKNGKYSAGLPWAVNVKNKDDFYSVSFQIGFVGAQAAVASEMIRDGILYGNEESLIKGKEILDFWTSDYVYKNALPPSWWIPKEDVNAGGASTYPSFLRCVVDGAEALLNACSYAKESEINYSQWEAAAVKIADFLVENQNEDGSYYRAYYTTGKVCKDSSNPAYQGSSKLNTPVAVRFLCEMYQYTGNEKYMQAAIQAADYCYENLYLGLGKYVGGTPDNPNIPDKEAAIYALYAFSSIYDLTGDPKYYPALQHAAVSVMSWIYTYEFSTPYARTTEYEDLNIFRDGNSAGWSIIATGHSSIDIFGSHAYYELFKQYLRCGNEVYLDIARLLQNNTKSALDLDGEWGYLYAGFALEACNIADQVFYTAENGVWLPWVSAAYLEPMIKMEETFGDYDVDMLLECFGREELLQKINGSERG